MTILTEELAEKIKRIEITARHLVTDSLAGEYHSVFKGMGMEFDEMRPYSPGDDVRRIDWNVTARRGRPFVKEHIEERELTALLIVDLSASKDFGTGTKTNAVIASEIAAILALGWASFELYKGRLTGSQLATVSVFWYFVVLLWPVLYLIVYL